MNKVITYTNNPLDDPEKSLWLKAESLARSRGLMSSWQVDGWYLVPAGNSCGERHAGPFGGVSDAFYFLLLADAQQRQEGEEQRIV